jgi:xanthine dehydrogenase accessory factor
MAGASRVSPAYTLLWRPAERLLNDACRELALRTLYARIAALVDEGQRFALATLVSASGSSPQNVGSRMVVLPDGRTMGTIGGGCMEAEARRVALTCLRTGAPRLLELRLDGDFGWDDGLICGGRVRIFIDPSPERSGPSYTAAAALAARRGRAVLCTWLAGPGRAPGTAEIWTPDDAQAPPALHTAAGQALEAERPGTVDEAGDTVYLEPIAPRPLLLVAGAGHIGAAVAQVAALCEFEVLVVDDRPAFANAERLPFADRVVVDSIPGFVSRFPIDERTYVVIVTRGHRHDAQVLRECIHSPARYLGMIGSRRKVCVIYDEMLRDGLATAAELGRVRSPMGLAIGGREVGEIAVAIVAELVSVRRGRGEGPVDAMKYSPPSIVPSGAAG